MHKTLSCWRYSYGGIGESLQRKSYEWEPEKREQSCKCSLEKKQTFNGLSTLQASLFCKHFELLNWGIKRWLRHRITRGICWEPQMPRQEARHRYTSAFSRARFLTGKFFLLSSTSHSGIPISWHKVSSLLKTILWHDFTSLWEEHRP